MASRSDSRVFRGSFELPSEGGGNDGRLGRGGAVCEAGEVAGMRGSGRREEAEPGAEEEGAGAEAEAEAGAEVEADAALSTCSVLVRGV